MRVLFWYCSRLAWTPTRKTIENVVDGVSREVQDSVVGFIHVEPEDEERASKVETKLVKNLKWLAGKWETKRIVLHSFAHLAEEKADVEFSQGLFERAHKRLDESGYEVIETPYGYFNDLELVAPGHPLARVFKQL